ncbi:MAG: DUF1800 domain-containing protein [Planctomycetota bacterium]|nr:MAG: DUF1800 domain-containing protein [Planctomycetota bacterium]
MRKSNLLFSLFGCQSIISFLFLFLFPIPLFSQTKDFKSFLDQKMSFQDARHLLVRTGFCASPKEIQAFQNLTPREGVKKILSTMNTKPETTPPSWLNEPYEDLRKFRRELKQLSPEEQRAMLKLMRRMVRDRQWQLKGWWMKEMVHTSSPFTERMVLFWHNHFTSSLKKCRSPKLMYQQLQLYRKFAKGNFKKFVKAVTRNPAMIIYLDTRTNRKGKPNENFARELMELFTLGEGHYTEEDIKQSARAFTGYSFNPYTGEFFLRPRQHDWGKKKFMGKEGYFLGDDIVDIIFQKKAVSLYITRKLWKEFISPNPAEEEVERLAKIFRDSKYELEPLLEAIFTSPYFWDPKNRGTLIKSPIEMVIGTIRLFQFYVKDYSILARAAAQLGQNPLDPPNVKGWEGGIRWITTSTLLYRRQILMNFIRGFGGRSLDNIRKLGKGRGMGKGEMMKMAGKAMEKKMMSLLDIPQNMDSSRQVKYITRLLLPLPPVQPIENPKNVLDVVQHCLLDISYQLK